MKLEYQFKNKNLFKIAMTHPSMSTSKNVTSYERMEFLGDSILSAIIAEAAFKKFPDYSEGQLSVMLANLVNSKTIVIVANKLEISPHILMAAGEEHSGGRDNPNNLENVMEALIGAIYLDSDFNTVRVIVNKWWHTFLTDVDNLFEKDNKTKLQEIAQKKYKLLPKYKIVSKEGQAHDPIFTVTLSIKNLHLVSAVGKSKKEAEQVAAEQMLKHICK